MKNISFFIILFSIFCQSQNNYTSAELIEKSELQYKNQLENSIVKNIQFVNIGPSVMSGRVTDLEVNPKNTTEFYVAYASGGLWHTINNGTTFEPIMDNSITQNIGDFAIDWESKTIFVGTGESNSSRSSYPGIGIIKSTDNGKTWHNVGLRDSHHISRILINPKDNQHIVVAVIGHLYSKNKERGIFNSFDGGKTWTKSLYIKDNTGAIDIVYDPSNFNIQYAAFWERERNAWNFLGSGANSGIYKTIDGGKNWKKISTADSGFPVGDGVGRIGLAIYDSSIIYAVLDNQFRRKLENKSQGLQTNASLDTTAGGDATSATIRGPDQCAFVNEGVLSELVIFGSNLYANVAGPSEDSSTLYILPALPGDVISNRGGWRDSSY